MNIHDLPIQVSAKIFSSFNRFGIFFYLRMIRIVARTLATTNRRSMDPIQAIFVNKIRAYRDQSAALGGPVGADGVFKQEQADIMERLSRTYGKYYI